MALTNRFAIWRGAWLPREFAVLRYDKRTLVYAQAMKDRIADFSYRPG